MLGESAANGLILFPRHPLKIALYGLRNKVDEVCFLIFLLFVALNTCPVEEKKKFSKWNKKKNFHRHSRHFCRPFDLFITFTSAWAMKRRSLITTSSKWRNRECFWDSNTLKNEDCHVNLRLKTFRCSHLKYCPFLTSKNEHLHTFITLIHLIIIELMSRSIIEWKYLLYEIMKSKRERKKMSFWR